MSDEGLFGPGTLTWRVNREGVLLLGGGAALILQLAHPLVAAGVAQHSNYRADPWGRYYQEQKLLGEQFGVPRERQPDTFADFNEYFHEMVAGDATAVTDALRDVVDATLNPPLPRLARPLVEALNLATVGLLPAPLRDELGLPWSPLRRRLLDASRAVLSAALPALPRLVRDLPPARRAERRLRAA